MKKEILFVTGGCKSGKSAFAQAEAEKAFKENRVFLATCQPLDSEMEKRIARHQADRDQTWKTVEEPVNIPEAIESIGPEADVILLDCITLWITNLMLAGRTPGEIEEQGKRLVQSIKSAPCMVVVVSNEVGAGIVPENKLARAFRDAAGMVNQMIAACADKVVLSVAGIPVVIKDSNN